MRTLHLSQHEGITMFAIGILTAVFGPVAMAQVVTMAARRTLPVSGRTSAVVDMRTGRPSVGGGLQRAAGSFSGLRRSDRAIRNAMRAARVSS